MAYNPQEDFQHIMDSSQKAQDALRQKNAQSHASDDEGKKSGGGGGGGKEKSSGKSGGGEKKDTGLADAMQAARDRWTGPAAIAFPGHGSPLVMSNAHQLVMKELTDRGVRPEVAAGAVGSLMGESGNRLNPRAFNPNDNGGPSGGIAQWHNERLDNLYKFAGTNDIRQIPLETQVKFLGHELDTSHSKVLDGLRQGRTVADGVNVWTRSYEVPANVDEQIALRMKHADQVWAGYQNNQNSSAAGGGDYVSGLVNHYSGKSHGESDQCVALVKNATDVGHTSNWKPGGGIDANTPVGTPIATFGADGQYKNTPGQSHAAIYLGPGSQPGSIKVLDQWKDHPAGVREIHPGDRAESAQNFQVIGTRDGSSPGLAKAPGVKPNMPATRQEAIPSYASIHMDDKAMPAGARTYMDDANVRGNPQEGRTYNISDLEAQDMAKAKNSVRTQDWKDAGAAENARNRTASLDAPLPPDRPRTFADQRGWQDQGAAENNRNALPASPDAPLPPERPRTFADQKGWQDQGAAENNRNALPASPDVPLPPEKPAEYALPTIDQGPAPGAASVPNPTANVPLPPTRPDNIQPATSGPQQHANYGPPMPNIGPPMPAQSNVPTPPPSSDRPQQAVPTPPPSSDRPQPSASQPAAQNGTSGYTWDALQGWVPASGAAGQQAQQPASDTDFGGWLSSLFENPDNLNESGKSSEAAPSADAGGDFDLGAGLSGIGDAVGSFFAGFQKGGPVQSFARGGLVAKDGTRGRPNRVASAQPGVALPPADRGTGSGGGYTATIATSPGYALGGPIDDASDNDVLGGGEPAPAQEAPQAASSAPVVKQSALPSEDVAPIIGPNSQEAKQQAAMEKYAEQRRISQESKQPKNLRELLAQTAFNVVSGVQEDYGIDKAVQRHQSQAVPSGNEPDPVTAFFNMLSGAPEEAASADQVRTLAHAVDPYDKMTEGMRTTAGMAAGVEYLLDKGDYKGAQEMARSVMFHQQLQTAKWGDKAVDLMRQGKKDDAIDAMVKGQSMIPDGTNVKAKSIPGGAVVQQTDENGKVLGNYKLTDAQMMGMALGLKDGSAYWQAIVHLANGDKIDGSGPDAAYERWQTRPEAATPTPDTNSPMYKAHQEAIQIAGPQPALPADFAQMSPDHQKLVRQQIAEDRQGWNTRYSQAMQGNRQQQGFGQQNANREASQTFQQDQQGRAQKFQQEQQGRAQEFTTQRDANKPMTPGAMGKIQEGVTNAFDELNQTIKVENPERQAAIKSAAAGLRAADPSVTDADAVRAAAAITSRGANIQIGRDGKTLIMPDGREFKALPNVIEMRKHIATPPAPAATQQPSASW